MIGIVPFIITISLTSPEQSNASFPFEDVVMLTRPDQFVKTGESSISPTGRQVVFQAVPTPPEGESPESHYSMYLADLVQREEAPRWSLDNIRRLSPEASANTCGSFHPLFEDRVIFATTIEPPGGSDTSGYQRDKRYDRRDVPSEMRIVETRTDGDLPAALRYLEGDEEAYQAECSISPDGRHLLYMSMESGDGDIFVKDLETGERHRVLSSPGYDGDSFFSPDGKRICYRSDRNGDDALQIFVSELAFNEAGTITGIEREFQITDNGRVNWAPFWHSSGRYLVYSSSEAADDSHEIYIADADAGSPPTDRPARYGTRTARVTNASGFDGFPAFDADSKMMIWTSQRADGTSQLFITEFPDDPEIFFFTPKEAPPSAEPH